MISLSLAMLLLAAPADPHPPMLCQADLPPVDGRRIAWFNLMADAGLRPVSSNLFLRTDAFEAQWRFDGQGLDRPGAMIHFRASLRLAARPQEPVTLTVVPDPGTRPRPRRFSSVVTPSRVSPEGWEIVATQAHVPNIFGKTVTLIVSDGAGREVVRQILPFRDWRWLESEAAQAVEAAEAKRQRKQCGRSIMF